MTETRISKQRLRELERAEAKLMALEAGGVDNWEWYAESLKQYDATVAREGKLEECLNEICTILAPGVYEPSERGTGFAFSETVMEEALGYLKSLPISFGNPDS